MKRFRRNCRKALAGFMSVWLSGALLLFCQMPAKASGTDFCPLAKASHGHCSKATNNSSELVSTPSSQAFDCCAFIPAIFDKTRKIEQHVKSTPLAMQAVAVRAEFRPAARLLQIRSGYISYQPSRDRVFLKNSVFRI